jgi:hypothetical protein
MNGGLIRTIIARKPDGVDLADWIEAELADINRIKVKIAILRKNMKDTKEAFEKTIAGLDNSIDQVRSECPHRETTRHNGTVYDAGWTECNHCGAEVRVPFVEKIDE